MAVVLSMPISFAVLPDVGLDPSWMLSLQLAAINGKVFGKEFVFTYGPLGYLIIHAAVNKSAMLLYDLFALGSLLCIYRNFLNLRPTFGDALQIILLSVVIKTCWLLSPAAILFTILSYWLWRIVEGKDKFAVAAALISATVLFFGKVNYGLIMVFLMPAFALGLLLLQPKHRLAGIILLPGFPILIWLGALAWHVDLPNYLRSGIELIAGYNEAMFAYSDNTLLVFELAVIFLAAIAIIVVCGLKRIVWRDQAMLLPLLLLGSLLLFKNAFSRFDPGHQGSFFAGLPLLLVVWCIGWRGAAAVRVLLLSSLCYPLALLIAQTKTFGLAEIIQNTPLRYFEEVVNAPQREDAAYFEAVLRWRYPQAALPTNVVATIGPASVDVMPWETSIVFRNGLNYDQRPVPQSYSVYTPWLDQLNADFLKSTNAPDFMFYACAQMATIDGRPAVWDESITKMALLENYTFESEFSLPMRVMPNQSLEPAPVYLLEHTPHARRFVPVATNEISLALGQPISIPATTNYLFLTLDVKRTLSGKFAAAALSPEMLIACFQYQDGSPGVYRAILPILKTGVLINHRVESPEEFRNWLQGSAAKNLAATTLDFKTHNAAAFQTPLQGRVVEYRLEDIGDRR